MLQQHMHMKSDEADKRRSCCPRRVSVSTRYSCVGVNTLLAYVPCVNIHLLHTMPSQRQYGFNRGGINSAITVERLYGAKPLTVGQYISHQSLSRPSKKKKSLWDSLLLSVIPAQHTQRASEAQMHG